MRETARCGARSGKGIFPPQGGFRENLDLMEESAMDFEFTEEQKMLQDMAYKFAKANFSSVSEECDEGEKYTAEIRKKAAA